MHASEFKNFCAQSWCRFKVLSARTGSRIKAGSVRVGHTCKHYSVQAWQHIKFWAKQGCQNLCTLCRRGWENVKKQTPIIWADLKKGCVAFVFCIVDKCRHFGYHFKAFCIQLGHKWAPRRVGHSLYISVGMGFLFIARHLMAILTILLIVFMSMFLYTHRHIRIDKSQILSDSVMEEEDEFGEKQKAVYILQPMVRIEGKKNPHYTYMPEPQEELKLHRYISIQDEVNARIKEQKEQQKNKRKQK